MIETFKFTGDNYNQLYEFCRGYVSIRVTSPNYDQGTYVLKEIGTGKRLEIHVGDTVFYDCDERCYGLIVGGVKSNQTIRGC